MRQDVGYRSDASRCVVARVNEIAPYGCGPAGIVGAAADDVEMKLRNDVADSGKIDFVAIKLVPDEAHRSSRFGDGQSSHRLRQVE